MNANVEGDTALPSIGSRLEAALTHGREGHGLERDSALSLANDASLADLLCAASEVRARGKGTVVTFSRKVFIPLTTLCRDYCGYCTFRKDPGQPGAHFMTPEEVLALAEQGRRAGCKEALFSLGDQPEHSVNDRLGRELRPFGGVRSSTLAADDLTTPALAR